MKYKKSKSFKIAVKAVKPHRHIAPAVQAHRDKRNDYNRKKFNDARNWEE